MISFEFFAESLVLFSVKERVVILNYHFLYIDIVVASTALYSALKVFFLTINTATIKKIK
jgi:hypothetical protein